MILHYKNGIGIFEGSWDLPRSFQDLEVFGLKGSVYMTRDAVEFRQGREAATRLDPAPLPLAEAGPIAYMVNAIRSNRPVEGLTALDINVGVVEIIEAAKMSVKSGKAVPLPISK
jgi:predicted dehydrogenase